jgi:hypothetical protein
VFAERLARVLEMTQNSAQEAGTQAPSTASAAG